ncbi:PTS transporter subunit EIIC [Spiroplasma mirum]|nr:MULTISPECIES: PTS transporter subunit EIIC [Spiroplasma]
MSGIAKVTYGDGFGFGSSWNIGETAADGHVITLADWGATKNFNLLQMAHVLMIINNIANIGFGLIIPIMGGYIAFSIAGRPGIAPAIIVTYMLVNPGSGLWWDFNGALNLNGGVIDAHQPFQGNANNSWTLFGTIYSGLICGYLVKYVNSWKVPKWLAPIMPIIIIIIISLFCTAIVAIPTPFLLAALWICNGWFRLWFKLNGNSP